MKKKQIISTSNLPQKLVQFGIVAIVILTQVMPANAQLDPRDDFKFGVKAGANLSNVWDEQGNDFRADSKFGFAAGAWLGIPIGTYLGFQPEVLLSQKGFEGRGTLLGTEYSFRRTTTYMDVPLQLQVKPATFLTIVGGPQYSFLLSENNSYSFGSNSIEQEQEFANDNIRRNILGFVIGADVILQPFVFSGRVGWDVLNNHGDGTSSTPRYKNRWLQLTAGFQF